MHRRSSQALKSRPASRTRRRALGSTTRKTPGRRTRQADGSSLKHGELTERSARNTQDVNKDGTLSDKEIDAMISGIGMSGQAKEAAAQGHNVFDMMDVDKNGKITRDELRGFTTAMQSGNVGSAK